MNIVKCINGHFYDSETYRNCPTCGKCQEQVKEITGGKGWLFKKKDNPPGHGHMEDYPRGVDVKTEAYETRGNGGTVIGQGYTGTARDNMEEQIDNNQTDDGKSRVVGKTWGLWDGKTVNGEEGINSRTLEDGPYVKMEEMFIDPPKSQVVSQREEHPEQYGVQQTRQPEQQAVQQVREPEQQGIQHKEEKSTDIETAVIEATANYDGKTFGYFSIKRDYNKASEKESSSTANYKPEQHVPVNAEPVVGWLVCVRGKHLGQSFNIYAGNNSVGRNNNNRIVLPEDNSVSREKHAIVVFEPKKAEFYIKSGDSNGLVYLNGETVFETKRIEKYDKIEIGATVLMMIPLCGEQFSWEDYLN